MTIADHRLIRDAEGLNTASWPVAAEHFITPTDRFFTRSHAPVPRIDAGSWRLEVGGLVDRPRSFSLEELTRELPGELPWGPEPVSTGEWTGVALGDLLRAVGVSPRARHVELVGLDRVERGGRRFGFGGSIDLAKALSDEVLLAASLNGAPLPAAHGFPLRAVVPGWIGARSVKWLGLITLAEEPSENYFQTRAYRFQPTRDRHDPRDVSAGTALTGVPLNAVILHPAAGRTVAAGRVRVRGWAMGAEGRPLAAIEVSADGGRTWLAGRVVAPGGPWTWSFWEADLELVPGSHTLAVRARDTAGTMSNRAAAGRLSGIHRRSIPTRRKP